VKFRTRPRDWEEIRDGPGNKQAHNGNKIGRLGREREEEALGDQKGG
jgi:hypothetical protein